MGILKHIILPVLLLAASLSWAQTNALQEAIKLYRDGDLEEAQVSIEQAVKDSTLAANPTTWYLRGFIYKDLYKEKPQLDTIVAFRALATQSFIQLLAIDNSGKYNADAYTSLKYIGVTLYNDAIKDLEAGEFERSKTRFEQFKANISSSNDTTIDVYSQEVDYYLNLGSLFTLLNQQNDTLGYLDSAKLAYNHVLGFDSLNVKANYNMGVLFYNQAVSIINDLDYDEVDLVAFSDIEDQSIELFKQSLPYMELAYSLAPNDRNTIEGLAGIYFSLRDFDKSNEFKAKLDTLPANGKN